MLFFPGGFAPINRPSQYYTGNGFYDGSIISSGIGFGCVLGSGRGFGRGFGTYPYILIQYWKKP